MLKSFKDFEGNKVKVGDLVSLVNNDNTTIMIVDNIQRSRRKVEVCLLNQATNRFCYAPSTLLIKEN